MSITQDNAKQTPWARYVEGLHFRSLSKAIGASPGGRWIQLGCASGGMGVSAWLAPRVEHLLALDFSAEDVAAGKEQWGANDNIQHRLLPRDPRELAADSTCRDQNGAVAIWTLQQILEEDLFHKTLDLLALALRPGALLVTMDRLSFADTKEDTSGGLRLRTPDAYRAAFLARGFAEMGHHPVQVDGQVMGRPWLTRKVKDGDLGGAMISAVDLAWARRQEMPPVADYIWRFKSIV